MKKRLIEFFESLGITQNAFEDSCGLTRGTITKLNLGLRSDKLAQIASAYPELNLRWLLLGEGEMLLKTSNGGERMDFPSFNVVGKASTVYIGNVDELARAFAEATRK